MDDDEGREIVAAMREAMAKSRGYADYFGWASNRDLEELGVLQALSESVERQGRSFYRHVKVRGRGNDPPDCEALDYAGRRIAVEVTELVNADAIRAYKSGRAYDFAFWDRDLFLSSLTKAISRKDAKFDQLRDPPYDGGYELIVFTDEPMVSRSSVEKWLTKEVFRVEHLSRAVLLLGYDPGLSRCPFYELPLGA